MNKKTIITLAVLGVAAVGAYFYFRKSDTPIAKSGDEEASEGKEEKSECGGCNS